jgi:signal transduction histidine kinase
VTRLLDYLPRGNMLDDKAWRRRHQFLQWVLLLHLPGLFLFGVALRHGVVTTAGVLVPPALCLLLGRLVANRRLAAFFVTAGLVYCSSALVGLSNGSIEAHFHFFIMIGFIALYQDWVPFLWNIVFTVLSHGIGSLIGRNLIFNHPAGQTSPWVWSAIHGAAVLVACVGVVVFWRTTEDEQQKTLRLSTQLAEAELGHRRFTSDLLVNLARRNQSMLYRQLDIINQLEDQERDPDALSELFRLDHLATRIRRNAESLLVLSGEEPARAWGEPVPLFDVVRAAIAETEDLDRVVFAVDERLAVLGRTVTDLTHLLAELMENAVRFSPPEASVTVRTRPYLQAPGAHVLTVEDWGVGMPPDDLAAANDLLTHPRDVDLSVSKQLGLHVVARLAQRHDIQVSLTPTPGCGVTAVVVLPASLFVGGPRQQQAELTGARAAVSFAEAAVGPAPASPRPSGPPPQAPAANGSRSGGFRTDRNGEPWPGWWDATSPADEEPAELIDLTGPMEPLPQGDPAQPAAPAAAAPVAAAPVPTPVVAAGGPDGGGAAAGPQLHRRVPQAHLAPELRRPFQPAEPNGQASAPPDAARARDALSRYQASREAARSTVEDDSPTGGRAAGTGTRS